MPGVLSKSDHRRNNWSFFGNDCTIAHHPVPDFLFSLRGTCFLDLYVGNFPKPDKGHSHVGSRIYSMGIQRPYCACFSGYAETSFNSYIFFGILATFSFGQLLFTMKYMKETKGKSLEEIEEIFSK